MRSQAPERKLCRTLIINIKLCVSMKLCCSIIMQNRNRKVLKQHAKISLDSVMPQFMMNMNNFLGYFSIALGITFHLEREKLNSMMLRFPPQISNWI